MTDQQTDPPAAGDGQAPEHKHGDGVPTMDDVRKVVADALEPVKTMLEKLTGGGKPDPKAAPAPAGPAGEGSGIDAMIDAAVSKVIGDRDKQTAEQAHAAEHEKLRAAATERPPVDRPKRARWLGAIYDK